MLKKMEKEMIDKDFYVYRVVSFFNQKNVL